MNRRLLSGRVIAWPVVLWAVLGLVRWEAAGAKPKFSDEEIERLEAGEVLIVSKTLESEGAVSAKATAIVDAPPADVWYHVEKCGKYSEFMPRVIESRESERKANSVVCYVKIDMPFPLSDMWSETEVVHKVVGNKGFRRVWKFRKGTYKINQGAWIITPWKGAANRSLVRYQIKVAPESSVPRGILREAQRRSLPNMFKALRERVKQSAK